MAILRIRDENGKVQEIPVIRGNAYVLTDADKREIAEMISAANVSGFQTEAQVLALIQANMPVSGDEVSY